MSISMYEALIPTALHTLKSLRAILQKGQAHAEARQFDPTVLAASRLFPDMMPLTRQVQIATDVAKAAAARLCGVDVPKWEDNETTLTDLVARVDKAIDYLQGFKAEQFEGSEARKITVPTPRNTFTFQGDVYLKHWVLPNFFFHVTTTYALLRHNGVELGKADFLGTISG